MSLKTILVFPPHLEIDAYYVTPPIGLISLATVLKENNYQVEIQDHIFYLRSGLLGENENIYDSSADLILEAKPDIVGFYTQCVTYPSCLNISKRLKERDPNIKIVFGGHNSTFLDKETLENFKFVDVVVRGEGEKILLNLIKYFHNEMKLSEIKGITYRNSKNNIIRNIDEDLIENLDELPFLDYSLVPDLNEYKKLGKTLTILIESGRGCSYNCIFCSNCRMWQRKVRFKTVNRVIKEIQYFEDKYQPDEYYFVHDFFTFDKNYINQLCSELKSNNLNIKWSCRCRLNITKDILQIMKNSGCERVLYGVESGSKKILEVMNKQIDFEMVFKTIKNTIETGINPSLSFVMGLSEETYEDVNDTLNLILKCELIGNCYPFMQMISPLPGTPILTNFSTELERIVPTAFSKGITYNKGKVLDEDYKLINNFPSIFSSFYNIKNRNEDVGLVSEIAKNYCYIIEMFSHTYFYLLAELDLTEINLYLQWRKWLIINQGISEKRIMELEREEVWKYFSNYIKDIIESRTVFKYEIIKDLYKYQNIRYKLLSQDLIVNNHLDKKQIDINGKFILNCIVAVFNYNIKDIIHDLRKFKRNSYDINRTFFAFCRNGYNVNIFKINENIYGLLKMINNKRLCDLHQSIDIDEEAIYQILEMLVEKEILICA